MKVGDLICFRQYDTFLDRMIEEIAIVLEIESYNDPARVDHCITFLASYGVDSLFTDDDELDDYLVK